MNLRELLTEIGQPIMIDSPHSGVSIKRILIRNTTFQVISHVLTLAIGLATNVILSRYLGVERYGQFNYIFSFFYFFLAVNDFGVTTIVVREISRHKEKGAEIIGTALIFKIIMAVVFVGISWVIIPLMKFPQELRAALLLYSFILPIIALELPAAIFQVFLKVEYPSIIGIVGRVFGFTVSMMAVWMGYGLKILIMALLISEAISMLLIFSYSKRFVKPIFHFNFQVLRNILRSSIPIGITGIFVALINRMDFILLERMTDFRQVGLYSAAYRITNLLEAFPLMVMGTVYPLMSRYAVEDHARLRLLYKKSLLLFTAMAIPMGISITFLATAIIQLLFGNKFSGAGQGLAILVWSTVSIYLAISGGNLLISMGREKINLLIQGVVAIINIVLNILWIPTMGFIGAAWATTISFIFILIATITAVEIYLNPSRRPVQKPDALGRF